MDLFSDLWLLVSEFLLIDCKKCFAHFMHVLIFLLQWNITWFQNISMNFLKSKSLFREEHNNNYSKLRCFKSESRCHRRKIRVDANAMAHTDWVYLWCWKSPESCVVSVEKFSVVILRKCNSLANMQQTFRTLAPSTVVRLQFLTLPPTWLENVTSTLPTEILHKPVYL